MPLSADSPSRIRKHTRSVRFEGYARADGLWDIEAHLTDVKPDGYLLAPGVRRGRQSGARHVGVPHRAKTGTD